MVQSCITANRGVAVHVHLLHDGSFTAEDQRRLQQLASVGDVQIDVLEVDRAAQRALPRTGGAVVWLRLLLPRLLPQLERVLYLDGDTLVADSIVPLWNTALVGAPIGAVANVVEPARYPHIERLGISDPKAVFNSGVVLMDLERLRTERAFERVLDFAVEHDTPASMPWYDQDALNAVLKDHWLPLHPRWNAQNSLWTWRPWAADVFGAEVVEEAVAKPGILHFEGPHICKPWHYLCQHPWRERYREVLRETPWAATPLVDRTPATVAIGRLPEARRIPAFIWLLRQRGRLSRWRALGTSRRST
jgi:lipopolysaccharide biosynthesis glycosyltransferase